MSPLCMYVCIVTLHKVCAVHIVTELCLWDVHLISKHVLILSVAILRIKGAI